MVQARRLSHQSSGRRKFIRTCNVRNVTDLKVKEERRRLASATRSRQKKEEVRGQKIYTASFLTRDILG
ncbi:MAG: hypothetical protein JGK01_12595 [Microcoleus sp. PH2017_03_ELD_O_A]|nr:hypothetical protein [Microcoleus sp. PH2017_03_ELD_O_A]